METLELDDFTIGMQADDWAHIEALGLRLPEPGDYTTLTEF